MDMLQPLFDVFRQIIREEIHNVKHEEDRWITTEELMEYIGVGRSWISHRIKEIPHVDSPRRFKKSEIDEWLKTRTENDDKQEIKVGNRSKNNSLKVI